MKKTKFVKVTALVFVLLFVFSFVSCDKLVGGSSARSLIYQLNESGDGYIVVGTGSYKSGETVVIPDQHEGLPVTGIAKKAFGPYYGNGSILMDVTGNSVQIPETVTVIEDGAFAGLVDVTVDENNPIYYSENNCIIEKDGKRLVAGASPADIPEGVKSIAPFAFSHAGQLANPIALPASLEKIEKQAFCAVFYSEIVIAEGNEVFRTNGKNIVENEGDRMVFSSVPEIPADVKVLADSVFADGFTGEKNEYLVPASVLKIEPGAFEGSGAAAITVSQENTVFYGEGNCVIEKESKKLVAGCKNSVIPEDVTAIEERAFYDSNLESIVIPESVAVIGKHAFGLAYDRGFSFAVKEYSVTVGTVKRFDASVEFDEKVEMEDVEDTEDQSDFGGADGGFSVQLGGSSLTLWCEAKEQPAGWHEEWYDDPMKGMGTTGTIASITGGSSYIGNGSSSVFFATVKVYFGDEWQYVDGVPTANKDVR